VIHERWSPCRTHLWHPSARLTWVTAVGLIVSCAGRATSAQQYITDDAALTEFRACQVQMWHGERSSWILPVCTPAKNLELSFGFIAVWHDQAKGHLEYVAQVKTLFKPLVADSWGAGFVLGTGRDLTSTEIPRAHSIYAYIPISESFWDDRVMLHQNVGLLHTRKARERDNSFIWAVRGDGRLAGRVGRGLVGVIEIYGAERIFRSEAHTTTEYQAGLRTWIRPDRVQVDLTEGRTLWRPFATTGGPGWTIGLTLVTPPFL
jgi:hypothetical protein